MVLLHVIMIRDLDLIITPLQKKKNIDVYTKPLSNQMRRKKLM
jgi:hypothetical protein